MNHRRRLTPAAAAVAAALFLVTGCGAQHVEHPTARPPADVTTTPCRISADRVDQYVHTHRQLPACVRAKLATPAHAERCPVVADRIEQRITLGLELPSCVSRLQGLTAQAAFSQT